MSRAVFLDRDGVINRNVLDPGSGEYGAPLRGEDFELSPGAIEGMRSLQGAGFLLFLISNQPNYAKGKSSLEDLAEIHSRLLAELASAGICLTKAYYCYHHPRGVVEGYSGPCECRKPSPYLVIEASRAFGLELQNSWIIGDRATDIECGMAAGLRTIRVAEDHPTARKTGEIQADFEARDLNHAAAIVLGRSLESAE